MARSRLRITLLVAVLVIALLWVGAAVTAANREDGTVTATAWAFVPAIVAIGLALVSKQVYISLFAGIFTGTMLLADGNPIYAVTYLYQSLAEKLGENACILVFLVCLGILVVLMGKSGGSRAYGEWARKRITTRKGAMLATAGLGCLIFVDDYFNCLTVGSIMRPVTESHKVSKAKLAYIIDSTAAPVCIIAPISSWAAAVSGSVVGENGIMTFIKTIPFNLYALLTIAMVFVTTALSIDFFKMRRNEAIALRTGDLTAGETDLPAEDLDERDIRTDGKVAYLVVPIVLLLVCCVGGMLFNGFYYDWDAGSISTTLQTHNIIDAFSSCDAGLSLAVGSTIALALTILYYVCAGALTFRACTDSFTQGFKAMVPAILILIFAWTISGVMGAKGGGLEAKTFVENTVSRIDGSLLALLPAIFFVLACFIAFSTGTSWGTFGILIPIASTLVLGAHATSEFSYLMMSAILAGSVYGDHVSPISDTTIMSSSGAQCNHLDHVRTQMPYATLVAGICLVAYIVLGFIAKAGVNYGLLTVCSLAIGALLFAGTIYALQVYTRRKDAAEARETE